MMIGLQPQNTRVISVNKSVTERITMLKCFLQELLR